MTGRALIIRADARRLPLPDACADLIITSPPFYGLRTYHDAGIPMAGQIGTEDEPGRYVAALLEATREWMRVLKDSGSLWVNLGDKYAGSAGNGSQDGLHDGRVANRHNGQVQYRAPRTRVRAKSLLGLPWRYALACIDDLGLILRAEVIWSKPNPLPESAPDRVHRSHETWFHLVKQPCYFADLDPLRHPFERNWTPGRNGTTGRCSRNHPGERPNRMQQGLQTSTGHPDGAAPRTVWDIPTQPLTVPAHLGTTHYAAFPTEWPRRLITAWSPVGGLVLDPFGGTGTTALAALMLDRNAISADLSHDYSRLAAWRTHDPGERARTLHLPTPEPVPPGQIALFEDSP